MANTYSSLNIHYVFSTKNRESWRDQAIRERLWAFMGGIARENGMVAQCIGGVADHVHLLISMPPVLSPSQAMQRIKGGSAVWIKQTFPKMIRFAWQSGYGAFSVSVSHIADTRRYIQNQEKHHRKTTFKEEYLAFLKRHEVDYDEKYLWD